MRRRALLGSLALGTAALAGCGGRSPVDVGLAPPDGDGEGNGGDGDDDGSGTGTGPGPGGDSDGQGDGSAGDSAGPAAAGVSLPYTGDPGETLDDPHGIGVENDSGRSRYVTVVVTTVDGRELLVASREVGDESTVRFPDVIAKRGLYDVVVESADGERLTRRWRVDDARGDLAVRLDRGLTARGTARCSPDCPPISTGGDLATFDAADARGTVHLLNRRDEPVTTELSLASERRLALRWGYEVPPDVQVAVPAVGWGEPEYTATVVVDGDTWSERWRRADGQRLFAVVDDEGTQFLCDTHVRDLRVRNETDRERSISVTVLADGAEQLSRTVTVPATSSVRRRNVVAPANQYGFELSTADGESTSTNWSICPQRGAIEVICSEDGLWVGVRSMR